MSPQQPEKFGRFEVKRLLGRGAMGTVYLAEDPVIGRQVAIKVLRTHSGLDGAELAEATARFRREFQSAGTLTHPSIVTVYDVGHQDENPFIAMEYVRGESLESVLQSERSLTFKEVSDLATQMASALDYAHERNIVHRDIKPANILMTWDGHAKVTDFGVAKLTNTTMTRTGTIIGTPAYMAPEQVTGHPVTGTADQFSLGVILYQLLTGSRPFSGESPTAILYKIVHEQPLPPQDLNRALPPRVNEVLLKALAKDSNQRYANCLQLAQAIRKALGATAYAMDEGAGGSLETTLHQGASEAILKRRAHHEGGWRRWLWLLLVAAVVGGLWYGWGRLDKATAPLPPGATATESEEPAKPQDFAVALEVVSAVEGQEIWVDGKDSGQRTPGRVTLEGPIGTERVVALFRNGELLRSKTFILNPQMASEWQADAEEELPARSLKIVSRPPGAKITFGGELLPQPTPLDVRLEPGETYELRLELEGYKPEGTTLSLATLPPEAVEKGEIFFPLALNVPPGAVALDASYAVKATVGGKAYGPSAKLEFSLAPGNYRVELSAPEVFFRKTETVTVTSGGRVALSVPNVVKVNISAVPGNCKVKIDGREVDFTPINDLPVTIGAHEIEFDFPALGKTQTRREVISSDNNNLYANGNQ